jgi:hypothetical protein
MKWEEILKRGVGITKNAFAHALEFIQNSGMIGEYLTSKQLYYNLRDALEVLSQGSKESQLERGFMVSHKAALNLESAHPEKLIWFAIRKLGVPKENQIEWRSPSLVSGKAELFFKVPTKDEWKNTFR